PITIEDCSLDGKYIRIGNTSKSNKDADLTKWRLLRKVDNQPEIIYLLPPHFVLGSGTTVSIYAKEKDISSSPNDLVFSTIDTWGMGSYILTRLLDEHNIERATHTQQIVHSSHRK
ncbi:unnamed protein product, partial [Didymodactylos carnosus]